MISADISVTSMRPPNRADRFQSNVSPSARNQTPVASAMVSDSIVARDDRAPSNPSIVTCRLTPDRLSSIRPTRKPRSRSA